MHGNKAKNLSILEKNGFNVPNFFTFSEDNLLIYSGLKGKLNLPLILRSSYSLEDGRKNAFAGIFESYFPIYTSADYNKGLQICLGADKLDKFKTYVELNNISTKAMTKNFVLQEFIVGDFSGVCFTKDINNKLIIEIVPGLNEPLVQGKVQTPFSISIDRNSFKDYHINNFYMDQSYQYIKNKVVTEVKFDLFTFEEDILINFKNKLIYEFLKVEKLFGYPQDIEFTVKGTDIFILQSRDITTL